MYRQTEDMAAGWPGHGDPGKPGPLEDNWACMNTPGDLGRRVAGGRLHRHEAVGIRRRVP